GPTELTRRNVTVGGHFPEGVGAGARRIGRKSVGLQRRAHAPVDRAVAHVLDCGTGAAAIRGLLEGRAQLKCSRVAESPIPSSLVQRLQSSIMAWPEIFHAGISCMDLLK